MASNEFYRDLEGKMIQGRIIFKKSYKSKPNIDIDGRSIEIKEIESNFTNHKLHCHPLNVMVNVLTMLLSQLNRSQSR